MKAVNSINEYVMALYLVLQMGLREIVGSSVKDGIIAKTAGSSVNKIEPQTSEDAGQDI